MATMRNFEVVSSIFYVEFLKGKLVLVQVLWYEEGNGSIARLIFNLGTKLRLLVVAHTLRFTHEKRPAVIIKLDADWIWTLWTRDTFIAFVGN